MSISFTEAIRIATEELLQDSATHVLGLGASYKNGLDGTMGNLAEKFPAQVHDMPCSENAITGMAVGMATTGLKPIVHHGRIEFAFHAFDQILTQAAKWEYMFGGDYPCPLTIRIAMGRQWGNGPQHTFTQKGIFAVPGLQVVAPSSPYASKHLLIAAHNHPGPVIYLESRWLYKTQESMSNSDKPEGAISCGLSKARVLREGNDITIVAVADMVLEALRAARLLAEGGIDAEVIDLVSVYPIDWDTIHSSVSKTGYLIAADAATPAYSVAHEIVSRIDGSVCCITCPDMPCPTAPALTASYYPQSHEIANAALKMLCKEYIHYSKQSSFAELNLAPTDDFDVYFR
jgi:acetoin:2,6-dichlorophenolindophenol oxidoreductase subunit beta